MELRTYHHLWGVVGDGGVFDTLPEFLDAVADLGYDGIEYFPLAFELLPDLQQYPIDVLGDLLGERALGSIPMLATFGATPDEHLAGFRAACAGATPLGGDLVVAHAGADWFDDATSERFLAECLRIAADHGLRVAFETHRGRILYNPWRTVALLDRLPELRLAADLSHFVCVAERLLADQDDVMARIAERSVHAHIRVGFEGGPQVPDPRDPRWGAQVAAHEQWWDAIWDAAERRGDAHVSIDPEYGPFPYGPADQPAVDRWEICQWAAERARSRFAQRT